MGTLPCPALRSVTEEIIDEYGQKYVCAEGGYAHARQAVDRVKFPCPIRC